MNWFDCLPPAETSLPCGDGSHTLRWEAGRLSLPGHPDAEAELILGALGGDKPACVTMAETWDRHLDDLTVLMAGPRGPADPVSVTWDQARQLRTSGLAGGRAGGTGTFTRMRTAPGGPRLPRTLRYSARGAMASGRADGDLAHQAEQQSEVLQLLALGPAFQFRLSGAVAAAWAVPASQRPRRRDGLRSEDARNERLNDEGMRRVRAAGGEQESTATPAVTAALTGRFAPVAARWLGLDPAAVTVTPHDGPGWGHLTEAGDDTATGTDATTGQKLAGSLPVSWLAGVWACGLALVDGHLTVAVEQAGYPRARVLALPAPGAAPVSLAVEAEEVEAEDVEADDPAADGAAADRADRAAAIPRWHRVTR